MNQLILHLQYNLIFINNKKSIILQIDQNIII